MRSRDIIMKYLIPATIAGALAAFSAQAQESIYTNDVVVTASRIEEPRDSVLSDVSVITREEIERAGQSTLVELLRTQPGVQIESNGGFGATSNVHLRGTHSQAVVVLIDGMRMGSATNGTTALEQIPTEQIERIEIVRGSVSSLYGSDAVGGVIQIFTRKAEGKPAFSANLGYGSYNTRKASVSAAGEINGTGFALSASSIDTNGFSTLDTRAGQDGDDDNYRNLSVSGRLTRQLAEGHKLGFQFFHSKGSNQYDSSNFDAYQNTRQQIFALTSDNRFTHIWTSHLKIGESMDDLSSVGAFGTSTLRTKQLQYYWQNDLILPAGTLTLAYDRLEDRVDGSTDFSRDYRSNNGWLANYILESGPHAFRAGIRRDDNSQFGDHETENLGYGYRLNNAWRISGNVGTAFRAPTFNDLYWPFQDFGPIDFLNPAGPHFTYEGNPDLKPETSRNKEITLTYDQGHHRVSATMYHNKIEDLIVGTQGLNNDFPVNVGNATIKGATLAYEGWFSSYHARANLDVLSPKNDDTGNILVRRARQYATFWLGRTMGDLEVTGEVIVSGDRYNDAANTLRLAGYTLVNLTANYRLDDDWSVNARVDNLFDRDYALASTSTGTYYNTPRTSLFVGLRWQPK
jgi:vitamin B12 transporter